MNLFRGVGWALPTDQTQTEQAIYSISSITYGTLGEREPFINIRNREPLHQENRAELTATSSLPKINLI
jgi:hypothetical protein